MYRKEINIAVSFNDKFFMPANVMLHSLYKNNKDIKINLFLLFNSLSQENREKIKRQTEQSGNQYNEIYINSEYFERASLANNPMYSIEIYYRILLPYILDIEKILWLDADTIITGEISDLYNTEIHDYYLAACIDVAEKEGRRDDIKSILKIESQIYFNSGVLLMNCKKIRQEVSEQAFFDAIDKYSKELICPDQDILNYVLGYKTLIVDDKNNYLYHMNKETNDALIVHYIYKKPWNIDYYGFCDELFWKYADECGYESEHKNYTKQRKAIAKKELRKEYINAIRRKLFKG